MRHVGTHGLAMFAPGPFVIPACALPVIREFVWVRPLLLFMCESFRSTGDYAKGDMGEKTSINTATLIFSKPRRACLLLGSFLCGNLAKSPERMEARSARLKTLHWLAKPNSNWPAIVTCSAWMRLQTELVSCRLPAPRKAQMSQSHRTGMSAFIKFHKMPERMHLRRIQHPELPEHVPPFLDVCSFG